MPANIASMLKQHLSKTSSELYDKTQYSQNISFSSLWNVDRLTNAEN